MDRCVREMTAIELIEESNIDKKDMILSRLKEADKRREEMFERCETTISEQGNLIASYRTVLKDMIYSGWLNN